MIHYSLIPAELAFSSQEDTIRPRHTVSYEGVSMLVQSVSSLHQHEFEVCQLLSGNLSHYLDPRFQPGSRLPMMACQPSCGEDKGYSGC